MTGMDRPKPPAVWWIMLMCFWPWGGAVHAHRRIERYQEELAEWAALREQRARLRAEKELERETAAKREAIDNAFKGIT